MNELQNVDIKSVDKTTLVQRNSVKIDTNAPKQARLNEFIKQIKNPYCYLDGKTVVKISFSNTNVTLEDCISHYLKGL